MKTSQLDLLDGSSLKDATSFRNDRQLMMLPFFTLGRKPIHEGQEHRWSEGGSDFFIRNSPGEDGLPTMFDLDILIHTITQIVQGMNRGEPVSPRVKFHVHDCLSSIGRGTGGREYALFLQSMKRLKGTTVFTNVTSGTMIEDGGFGWFQSYKIIRRKLPSGKEVMAYCEVVICDWLFNAVVVEKRVLSMDPAYFALESGLERKVYQIIRAHLGQKTTWGIGLDRLHVKTGSSSPKKRFTYEMRQMVERDPFPEWALYLSTDGRIPTEAPAPGSRRPLHLVVYRRDGLRPVQLR
jgi:plasmid replication initiation protein